MHPLPMPSFREQDLLRRFTVRTERFAHGAFQVEMLLPRAADELIDEAEFDHDERLPYWAEMWPAARAMTRILLDSAPPRGRVVELGCGVALPSLALRWRRIDVLATDYYADALAFARVNAERNRIPPPRTRLVDWRGPPPDLGRFDLVLAADVLYERRNADALAGLLPRLVAPGGRAWIADPGRVYRPDFEARMRQAGWRVEERAAREEASPEVGEGVVSRVRIVEVAPPASAPPRPSR